MKAFRSWHPNLNYSFLGCRNRQVCTKHLMHFRQNSVFWIDELVCWYSSLILFFFKLTYRIWDLCFPSNLIFQARQFLQLMLIAANTRDHFAKEQMLLHLYRKYLAKKDLCACSKHLNTYHLTLCRKTW